MSIKKIIFTGGHGRTDSGYDPGAVSSTGVKERDIIESIGKYLPEDEYFHKIGFDSRLTVVEKVAQVNDYCKRNGLTLENSVICDLHCDWEKALSGVMSYYYAGWKPSENLANAITTNVSHFIDKPFRCVIPDTSSRFGSLAIIRRTIPLAMLLEMGSIGNDAEFLTSYEGQMKLANAIVDAFKMYYGIADKIFADVNTSHKNAAAIKAMLNSGIMIGDGSDSSPEKRYFYPDNNITRAELAEIIVKVLNFLNK